MHERGQEERALKGALSFLQSAHFQKREKADLEAIKQSDN